MSYALALLVFIARALSHEYTFSSCLESNWRKYKELFAFGKTVPENLPQQRLRLWMRAGHAPLLSSSRHSASSARWLARASRDPFRTSKAGSNNSANGATGDVKQYVARSAHKLLELDSMYKGLLKPGKVILDLGAAPGGWTQVCLDKLSGRGKVVAVDLNELDSRVLGDARASQLTAIQGDMRLESTLQEIEQVLDGTRVNIVLSDMLANQTGNSIVDAQASLDLCEHVIHLATLYMEPWRAGESEVGTVIMKVLQSNLADEWRRDVVQRRFRNVKWEKPEASRKESKEGYLVCRGYRQ